MTALAIGASITISLSEGNTLSIASVGGVFTSQVSPVVGVSTQKVQGPLAVHHVFGPYPGGGASVTLTNQSCGSLVYVQTGGGVGTSTIVGATDVASANLPVLNAPTAAKFSQTTSALGAWNLTTNVATAADGVTTFTPVSGTYPTSGTNFLLCGGTGTRALETDTYGVGDYATFSPALGKWVRQSNVGVTISATTAMKKGDGAGNAVDAVPGVDFMPGAILSCNVPVASAPDGTIGANGALTLTTAIGAAPGGTYTMGMWLYFPANAITGSNPAGFYWVAFTDSSHATISNNVYTPGVNSGAGSWHIPASPTPFSGTTGTAYTGSTVAITTHSFVIPGNGMGPNGAIRTEVYHRNNTTAGSKSVVQKYGTSTLGYSNTQTTQANNLDSSMVWNRGVTNIQESTVGGPSLHSNFAINRGNIDTTANFTLLLTAGVGVSTDWLVMESVRVTLLPGA